MARLEIREPFKTAPEVLWKAITTPETYLELGLVKSIRRIDGVDGGCWDEGARRELVIGSWRFVELVKNVRDGETMEVEVLENEGPLRQDYERLEVSPTADGCELIWTIEFTMKRGWLRFLDPIVAATFNTAYRRVLRKLRARIETPSSSA